VRILTGGGELTADAYILALDPGSLPGVLPALVRDDPTLPASSALSLPPSSTSTSGTRRGAALAAPLRRFPQHPVQWLFNKSRLTALTT